MADATITSPLFPLPAYMPTNFHHGEPGLTLAPETWEKRAAELYRVSLTLTWSDIFPHGRYFLLQI